MYTSIRTILFKQKCDIVNQFYKYLDILPLKAKQTSERKINVETKFTQPPQLLIKLIARQLIMSSNKN